MFAGAVVLTPDQPDSRACDSKVLDAGTREESAILIRERAVACAVAAADAFEIDRINILSSLAAGDEAGG